MSTNKSKKQWFWVILVIAVGLVLSALLFFTGKNKASSDAAADSHGEGEEGHTEGEAGQAESEEGSLNLSPKQMTEYGVKLAQVGVGEVGQQFAYPAKLVTNTDQQAHVSATFAGRVESSLC
jgi:cobalt-zinc-cadmium efflux system membrane fusion protein